jgi:UDP-GlcNAc:undecaprenyl-phosphate GlcNAc-1-phosphate transferase
MFIPLEIFQAILISLFVTLFCVPLGIWLARRVDLIDYPGAAPHKHHRSPTPMAGGIILVMAFVIGGSISGIWQVPTVSITFAAGLVVFVFGLWDDLRDIAPIPKLVGQLLAAVILIRGGVIVQIFESPEFFISLSPLAARSMDLISTTLWLIGITNAFNFIDSMDGLAVGIGGVAAAFFMLVTLDSGQAGLAIYSAGLVAMCMGIYFFNARPARLFLGDAGAQVLGFWLASLAIAYNPQNVNQMSSWFATILLLGVPIFDMLLVVISRMRRKRSIYISANDHTYHRLRNLGLDPNRAVLLMHIVAVVLGCLSIVGLNQPPLIANALFGVIVLCGAGVLIFFETSLSRSREFMENE